MKTLPISKVITLTEQTTSTPINIVASLIQRVDTDTGGSCLLLIGRNGSIRNEKLFVTQAPAAIAALSGVHVQLTEYVGGLSYYLNAMCIWQLFDETTYRKVSYNLGGQTLNVKVTQSLASLQAAINAANNNATANTVDVLAAGVNQGTATAVTGTSPLYIKITGGTGGILLPAATLGSFINIDSQVGVDLNAYPAVGGYIGGGAVNVPFVLQANGNASFVCNTAGYWEQAENTFPTVNADTVTSIGSTLSLAATTSVNVVAGGTTVTETLNSGGTGIFKVNAFMVVASGTSIPAAAPGPVVRNMYIDITAVAVAGHGIQLKSPAACTQYFISVGAVANALTIYDDAGVAVSIPVPANTLASLYYINGAWKATHSALV